MDEDSKKLLSEYLNAFPNAALVVAPAAIFVGFIYAIVYGDKGLPLFGLGIVYAMLRIFPRGKYNSESFYPILGSLSLSVFIAAILYYVAVAPSPSNLEASGYYALVGLSLALFLASIADLTLYMNRLSVQNRVEAAEKRLEEQIKRLEEYDGNIGKKLEGLRQDLRDQREADEERWGEEE